MQNQTQQPPQYPAFSQPHPQQLAPTHAHGHSRSRSPSPAYRSDKPASDGYYAPPSGQQGQHGGAFGQPQAYPTQPAMGAQQGSPLQSLSASSGVITCPRCHFVGPTKTEHESGTCTHIWGITLCVFFCCGCIPYCFNWSKDVKHKCSNCDAAVAMYKRNGSETVTYY